MAIVWWMEHEKLERYEKDRIFALCWLSVGRRHLSQWTESRCCCGGRRERVPSRKGKIARLNKLSASFNLARLKLSS